MSSSAHTQAGQPGGPAVVFFDGECGFCSRAVRFVAARDPAGYFRFASLQSGVARRLLGARSLPPGDPGTLVLLEDGRRYERSTAALRIARRLRWPWPALAAFLLVPAPLRDAAYRWVARNRHRLAGDACPLPLPEVSSRMLD